MPRCEAVTHRNTRCRRRSTCRLLWSAHDDFRDCCEMHWEIFKYQGRRAKTPLRWW